MFSIDTSKLPRITSWAEAAAFWRQAVPFKAEAGACYLGRRRDETKLIIKCDDGSYRFRLYDTDVVTYRADQILVIQPHDTASTVAFARWLVPDYVRITGGSGRRTSSPFRVNGCITRDEFIIDTATRQLLTDSLEPEFVVRRVAQKPGAYETRVRKFISLRAAHELVTGICPHIGRHLTNTDVQLVRHVSGWDDLTWQQQLVVFDAHSDEELIEAAMILDKTLIKERVPFGVVPGRTKYSHLAPFI